MKINFKKLSFVLVFLILITVIGINKNTYDNYTNSLYTPTSIEKINGYYFIVDCWQHRVIYNKNLTDKIKDWKVLSNELTGPHSIATDGEVLVVEDTERNLLKVFKEKDKGFDLIQIIDNVGKRPHKVIYDKSTKLFYSIASTSQEIVALENKNGKLGVKYKKKLDFLEGTYIRSINIIDGKMYFVSGPSKVICSEYKDGLYNIIDVYEVQDELVGMNYIEKIGQYYYITTYTTKKGEISPKIIRTKKLENLKFGDFEDLYEKFNFKGTPYYFSFIDDRVFITEIDQYSSIKSFRVVNDEILDITTHYDIGVSSQESKNRKNEGFNKIIK